MSLALAAVTAISILLRPGPAYEPRAFDRWKGLRLDARVLKNINTVEQRADFYRVAGSVALERPLFGWGFGTFRDHYARSKHPGVSRFESKEHNVVLELAVATGAVGLLAFLLFGVAIIVTANRHGRQDSRAGPHAHAWAAAMAIGAAYLAQPAAPRAAGRGPRAKDRALVRVCRARAAERLRPLSPGARARTRLRGCNRLLQKSGRAESQGTVVQDEPRASPAP